MAGFTSDIRVTLLRICRFNFKALVFKTVCVYPVLVRSYLCCGFCHAELGAASGTSLPELCDTILEQGRELQRAVTSLSVQQLRKDDPGLRRLRTAVHMEVGRLSSPPEQALTIVMREIKVPVDGEGLELPDDDQGLSDLPAILVEEYALRVMAVYKRPTPLF